MDPARWQREDVRAWMEAHAHTTPAEVVLGGSPFLDISAHELAQQLNGWQKARKKLPTWATTSGIAYPPQLSMEQCSSEETARWKAQQVSGKSFADLTGGLGVDTAMLAARFEEGHYVEQQTELAALAAHNFVQLGLNHLQVHTTSAEHFLANQNGLLDWIYLDPARRHDRKGKVFRLEDCTPDVIGLLPELRKKGRQVLLKLSPMLDVQQGLEALGGAERVTVLAVRNEVKELLFFVGPENTPNPILEGVNLGADGHAEGFRFTKGEEGETKAAQGAPSHYLYEPNASLMKLGPWGLLSQRFGLQKLHPNTHLYTSGTLVVDFPGRVFRILDPLPVQKKVVKRALGGEVAHVATRNFPMGADALRKKLGVKEGGSRFLFGVTLAGGDKKVLLAERVEGRES